MKIINNVSCSHRKRFALWSSSPQLGLSFLPRELGHLHPPVLHPARPSPGPRSLGLGASAPSPKRLLTGPGRAGATGPTVGPVQTGHTPDSLRFLQETVARPTPSMHLCALSPSPVSPASARPGPLGGVHGGRLSTGLRGTTEGEGTGRQPAAMPQRSKRRSEGPKVRKQARGRLKLAGRGGLVQDVMFRCVTFRLQTAGISWARRSQQKVCEPVLKAVHPGGSPLCLHEVTVTSQSPIKILV